jgi:hypothetical protein
MSIILCEITFGKLFSRSIEIRTLSSITECYNNKLESAIKVVISQLNRSNDEF